MLMVGDYPKFADLRILQLFAHERVQVGGNAAFNKFANMEKSKHFETVNKQ